MHLDYSMPNGYFGDDSTLWIQDQVAIFEDYFCSVRREKTFRKRKANISHETLTLSVNNLSGSSEIPLTQLNSNGSNGNGYFSSHMIHVY